MEPQFIVRTLAEARNETSPEIRSRLLDEVLSAHCTLVDREQHEVVGRAAIGALFGEELLDPEHWVWTKGLVSSVGDRYVFRWQIRSSIAGPRSELCWFELDGEGKVERLTIHHSADTSPSLGRQVFHWAHEHPAPALAAAAGILYAVLRVSMAIFYNQFDITPEEAGFTNDEVLRQSATCLGGLLLYGLFLMTVNWLVVTPLIRVNSVAQRLRLAQRPDERRLLLTLAYAPLVLIFAVLCFFLYVAQDLTGTLISLAALLAGVLVGMRLALQLPAARRVAVLADESVRRSQHQGMPRLLALVSALVAAAMLFCLPLFAYISADEVDSYGSAGGRFLPWRALPATVKWIADAPPVKLTNDCDSLRLLGESDDKVFLYDQQKDVTVRVPAADVIVSTGC